MPSDDDPLTSDHRWSGWPGAWCLDCGAEDLTESCIGAHPEAFSGPETPENPMGYVAHCVNPPCPEVGSNRHNPYGRQATKLMAVRWAVREGRLSDG